MVQGDTLRTTTGRVPLQTGCVEDGIADGKISDYFQKYWINNGQTHKNKKVGSNKEGLHRQTGTFNYIED